MIKSHTLENQFLKIKTINIGASLYEVIDKRKKINLILNLGNFKNYLKNKPYLGATAKECIDTITSYLSENRGDFVCIIAGYKNDLERCFFKYNNGLERRFPWKY